jgi:hypothetical protein
MNANIRACVAAADRGVDLPGVMEPSRISQLVVEPVTAVGESRRGATSTTSTACGSSSTR